MSWFILLLLGAIWGASYMFIKVGGAEIPPFTFVEVRTLVAAITLMVVLQLRGEKALWRTDWPYWYSQCAAFQYCQRQLRFHPRKCRCQRSAWYHEGCQLKHIAYHSLGSVDLPL